MRATVSNLENNHVKLVVELDDAEMSDAIDKAARTLSTQVSVKGFRKGKVPKNVLIAHIGGADVLRSEAIRESMPDFYARAIADTAVDPIAEPEITVTGGEVEGPLVFEADVEVRPEITISGHRALRVTLPSPQVTDTEVEAQIDRFRETDATLNDVDRPIVTGDLVTMDVTATQVAGESEPLEMSDYMYTVGSGRAHSRTTRWREPDRQWQRSGGWGRHLRHEAEAGEGAGATRVDRRMGGREHRVADRGRNA